MDVIEDKMQYESQDEKDAEVDSPDSDCNPYYNETINDDLYEEHFASDDDDNSSYFEGFYMYETYINNGNNVYLVV